MADHIEVDHEKRGDVTIIRLEGDLDQAALPRCSQVIVPLVMAGKPRLVFNLGGLSFIDSMGTAYLLMTCKRARQRGGDVVVCNASSAVDKTFSVLGMGDVLGEYRDEEEAVAHFKPG